MNLAGDAITSNGGDGAAIAVIGDAFNAVVVAVADVLSSPRSRARRRSGRVGG